MQPLQGPQCIIKGSMQVIEHSSGASLRLSTKDMLRYRLSRLHITVQRFGSQRASKPSLACLPRRACSTACSQRTAFAYASRPFVVRAPICARAVSIDRCIETAHKTNGSSVEGLASVPSLTFQEAITALEQYWATKSGSNCAILLPHNTEVHPLSSC